MSAIPRDHRSTTASRAVAEAQASTEGQRACSRGQWCASRTVVTENGERIISPALGSRAFCDHDADLIGDCISDLPAMFGRLQGEIAEPAITGATVHVPFGPSVPVRLDVDAAMRLTATLLRTWDSRVRAVKPLSARPPGMPVLSAESVEHAARVLENNLGVLLALQPGWMTHNVSVPPGRLRPAGRGAQAQCRSCDRVITLSATSGRWFAADGEPPWWHDHEHRPDAHTIIQPSATVSAAVLEEYGDSEIVRVGADFIGVFIQRDGAAAGLEILHLHYWDRAVLLETPARPEELLGVECKACSLLALQRAEPPWHKGDPEYFSECAECGNLMTEDDYRMWCGQLAAYHRARIAAMPRLAPSPAP